jgi:predicted dehydrogenase
MPGGKLRVGIIGLGHIGRVHLAALSALKGLRAVAVCDSNDRLVDLAPDGVQFFSDAEAFFRFPMDVVVVATPNEAHGKIAARAVRHGHSVIVEKPAAGSLAELDQLLAAAANGQTSLFFAFHAAHGKEVVWARDWVARQVRELGPVTAFASSFVDPYATPDGGLKPAASSLENAWRDSGVNALSVLAEFIAPSDLAISQTTVRGSSKGGVPIDVAVALSIVSAGAAQGTGSIVTRWSTDTDHKQTYVEFGKAGVGLLLDHSAQTVELQAAGGREIVADFSATGDRLLNHYLGLFSTYSTAPVSPEKLEAGRDIHELLFQAAEEIEGLVQA